MTLRIYDPDRSCESLVYSWPRRSRLAWFHAAVVDAIAFAVLLAVSSQLCAHCYTDPWSGHTMCLMPPAATRHSPLATQQSTGFNARITSHDRDGAMSLGSGTYVGHDAARAFVTTNEHVIRDTAGRVFVDLAGRNYPAQILDVDAAHDLAVLGIEIPDNVRPAEIYHGDPTGTLQIQGFGRHGQLLASRAPIVDWLRPAGATFDCARITTTAREGDSGGGAFTADGRFCGVLWGTNPGETFVTCGEPVRRILDRVWPGRPGKIIPHATLTTASQRRGGSHGGKWHEVPPARVDKQPDPPSGASAPPAAVEEPRAESGELRADRCQCQPVDLKPINAQLTQLQLRLAALSTQLSSRDKPAGSQAAPTGPQLFYDIVPRTED